MTRFARHAVLFVAAAAVVLVAPATASADSYLRWSDVATMPGNAGSTSPHGGYQTGSVKCAVCHAAHFASANGELLLQDSVANACNYCHVGGAGGYLQVYGGDPDNYSGTNWDNAHNSFTVNGVEQGVECSSCHQVHAADGQVTANAYLTSKMLKGAKTYDSAHPNYDPQAQAPLSTDSSDTALTKWCAGCHFTRTGVYSYYSTSYNQQTHVMTTATPTYSNPKANYSGQVAWKNSTYCASCHSSGYNTSAWPHYTTGMRFLEEASGATDTATGAVNPSDDGVCLKCHRQGTSGIGMTY